MDAQLKERAQAVAQLRNSSQHFTNSQLREIGEVYHLLTGRKVNCVSCKVYGLINEVNQLLIKEPLKITNMAAKAHFKTEHEKVQVIRHNKNGSTTVITADNLNEGDNLKFIAENNAHLLADTKAVAEATEGETAKSTSTSTKTTAKK